MFEEKRILADKLRVLARYNRAHMVIHYTEGFIEGELL